VALLDNAVLCDRLATEMNFNDHRTALLAMAAQWREAAEAIPAKRR
jgi:hypothetical protein